MQKEIYLVYFDMIVKNSWVHYDNLSSSLL